MAAFKGFGFKSPQEIVQETQAGFAQAVQSGNVDQQRFANARLAGAMLGKLPEIIDAQKTEKLLNNAYKTANEAFEDTDEVDDVERQIAFYREAQKAAIEAELPDIAMQATEQLAGLTLTQEERSRLKAQESRAAAQETREAETFRIQNAVDKVTSRHLTTGVIIDPQTLEVVDRVDMRLPEDVQRKKQLEQERPDLVFRTESEYIQLTEDEKDRLAQLAKGADNWEGRSKLYQDFHKSSQGAAAFSIVADDFVDILLDPNAETIFAAGGEARGLLERAAAHGKSLFDTRAANAGMDGTDLMHNDFAKWGNSDELKKRGINWNALSSDKKALVMELGYALATSREGGRLTDQDVERAIMSLGVDNPDPRAVAWVFGRALRRNRDIYATKLDNSGLRDIEDVRGTHERNLAALDNVLGRLSSQYEIDYDSYTQFQSFVNGTAGIETNRNAPRVREVPGATRNEKGVLVFDTTAGTVQ